MTTQEIVKSIIDEAIERGGSPKPGCVSKYFVIELIKNRIHPTQLFNKAIGAGRVTNDGVENIHRGAVRAYTDSIKALKRKNIFKVDDEGWITKKVNE